MKEDTKKDLTKDVEIFKSLYTEATTSFRYFLTWRKVIFTSYFAFIYVLLKALIWTIQHVTCSYFSIPALLLIIAVIISIAFLLLEIRNRALHYHAADTCANLEKSVNAESSGLYSEYKNKNLKEECLTHTRVIYSVYILSAIIMLLLAILFIISENTGWAKPPIIIS